MPTIVLATSKGGAGKTTATIVLACELARNGASVTLIDADPNQHSAKWANREGKPENITLLANANEDNIIDYIEDSETKTSFVIVDLEGTASMAVSFAISRADLVLTPCQGSQDDADEAVRTVKLIKQQEKAFKKNIPFSILITNNQAAIRPRTLSHIMNEFTNAGVPMLETTLVNRDAFRAIRSFGGSVNDLDKKQVSGIDKAALNAESFASEVIKIIKESNRSQA